jgi:anti-sigma regulatory factor (Ser/Thr protein kinase)
VTAVAPVPFVSFRVEAAPASVGKIRRRVVDFASQHGAGPAELGSVALAVSEAAANAVVHAYPGTGGPIYVEADVEDGDLELVVADDGHGFTTAQSTRLGAGLAVVARSCAAYAIRERLPHGVELWMRFPVDGR